MAEKIKHSRPQSRWAKYINKSKGVTKMEKDIKEHMRTIEGIIYTLHTHNYKDVETVISHLHILGDTRIGRDLIGGYSDLHTSCDLRVEVAMEYADINSYKRIDTEGNISHYNKEVREKALQVLAGMLKGANDLDKRGKLVHFLKHDQLMELVQFFSIKDNIPTEEPARKLVCTFLTTVYQDVTGPHYQTARLNGLMVSADNKQKVYDEFHKAVLQPLVLIGASHIFKENLDFLAIPVLEQFVCQVSKHHKDWYKEEKILKNIDEAIAFWAELTSRNDASIQEALICKMLKIVKEYREQIISAVTD